ncbi:MAG: HNH endonuclease [Deltaproteobacteria bacterium RIFCSPLOWO2_02_FULL_50_16]|nr:MAG: HNH endonuclease [Deltaproteobacteria bacterium GWA2_50_8]OGQ32186.1 MAG: HNH endonuclease [Deltaproteobacteria bacterium RIFCSPHIGHO2_02_FULL_50_15]OGQ55651.1 MAG: HNH endonuclease [Deltaproteobacteria bacterium RIFCSPLOWO2_02_FULL_50_16]OGQ68542.1 MAG: HNH endonuclease [Deltaproteobacteria bacterium RIFCSPLOWO2_12_FULL_50_11]
MLTSSALVLNRSFIPINITTVRRALILMYQEVARAVDHQYETFDFSSWSDLSASREGEGIHLVDRVIRVPRVILLTAYNRVPKRYVRFSRHNIYLRDCSICQYCGKTQSRSELNLEHVIPKSRGGKTTWENVVTSCIPCNRRKGGHLLEEVGMKLIRTPVRPKWTPFLDFSLKAKLYDEWKPFFNVIDFSYWNVELQQD